MNVKSTLDIAIKLIYDKYKLTNVLDIQDKLEEVFEIDTHYYNILSSQQYHNIRSEDREEKERIRLKTLTYM